MGKLPNSWKVYNRTTRQFRHQYSNLPPKIQGLTKSACRFFHQDPQHPSLRHHHLDDKKSGSHAPDSYSVSITMQYRAIYVQERGVNIWYWIGTHAEYDRFTGGKG